MFFFFIIMTSSIFNKLLFLAKYVVCEHTILSIRLLFVNKNNSKTLAIKYATSDTD